MIKKQYVEKATFPGCAGFIKTRETTIEDFYKWLQEHFTGKLKICFHSPMTHGFNGNFTMTKDFDLSFKNGVIFLKAVEGEEIFCFSDIASVEIGEKEFVSGDFRFII